MSKFDFMLGNPLSEKPRLRRKKATRARQTKRSTATQRLAVMEEWSGFDGPASQALRRLNHARTPNTRARALWSMTVPAGIPINSIVDVRTPTALTYSVHVGTTADRLLWLTFAEPVRIAEGMMIILTIRRQRRSSTAYLVTNVRRNGEFEISQSWRR